MSDEGSDISISDWLDDAYIHKILSAYENVNEIEILKYETESATKKGQNFASSLTRLRVQYCSGLHDAIRYLTAIVKSRLENEVVAAIETDFSIFNRESQVYKFILKECETLLKNVGDNTQFGPRVIYVDDRIIVLEDLAEQGYAMKDVRKGLDQSYCSHILTKLAKFHATTRILYEKKPELFKYHTVANVSEKPTPMHTIFENTMDTCARFVASKEDLSQYADKIRTYRKDVINKLIKVFLYDRKGFNVLNHGDMWVNNFMFLNDSDGNIQDVLFVDYQEGFYGSPGIDFNYFIYSSLTQDVYENHLNDLIQLYSDVLRETLSKLGAKDLPTLETINNEIQSKSDHGIVTVCCMYPILTTDRPDLADPIVLVLDDDDAQEKQLQIFDSKNYYNQLKMTLPDFVKKNLI